MILAMVLLLSFLFNKNNSKPKKLPAEEINGEC